MRVLITGGQGQLAAYLAKTLTGRTVIAMSHAELDITENTSVDCAFAEHRPEMVINTAAFHRVDECEREIKRSFDVNARVALILARSCSESGAVLVHVSTDYVFVGQPQRTPVAAGHPPAPMNLYGVSKVAGEQLIRAFSDRHVIVRSSGLHGARSTTGKNGNFVLTMLSVAREHGAVRVVDDPHCTPTYAKDFAEGIVALIEAQAHGTFHVVNDGAYTWFEFALEIFKSAGLKPDLSAVTSEEFSAPAARPQYSVLDSSSFAQVTGQKLRHWHDALHAYLADIDQLATKAHTH